MQPLLALITCMRLQLSSVQSISAVVLAYLIVTLRQRPVTLILDLLKAAMVTSTSGDAAITTSAVPLVWMYLFVVASRECLPRPKGKTVICFINLFLLWSIQRCTDAINAYILARNIA